MTSPLRVFAASSSAALLLLALSACSQTPTESASPSASSSGCAGVTVVVDASALDLADDPSTSTCVASDKTIAATDALAEAQVTTAGTTQYGDQLVCRVDGVPAEDQALKNPDGSDYFEKCEGMPAPFAYWSMWVQPSGGEWEYAQEGLSTLQLKPGEGLALLFTLNGVPASPTATP